MKQIPIAPPSAALVFVPFAIGYFLSYLFRSVNAVIAPNLAAEMGLSSAQLGLLTSTYFLTFALSQVPLGVLLDHYGPRRVQACLFAVAAVGALVFGAGTNLATLVAGRALIGLGVSGALMAALKAVVLAFPKERLALVNGCLVMFGGIGAYVAAGPTDALVRWSDWRLVFLLLAGVTALAALMILLVVPDRHRAAPTTTLANSLVGLRTVFKNSFFWRIAPASACAIGTAWAIQGLWAARWLEEVDGLSRGDIVFCLSAMAGALAVGALSIGIVGDRLKRAGVNANVPLVAAFTAFALLQMGIVQHLPIPRTLSMVRLRRPWRRNGAQLRRARGELPEGARRPRQRRPQPHAHRGRFHRAMGHRRRDRSLARRRRQAPGDRL